ncbi:MAG: fumarylacetoacetate hydrolase family protein [Acidobacteriota bacterium]|nr:fumarylacetoacetate hydrolase family protein [Acidobacteriota bacterium]
MKLYRTTQGNYLQHEGRHYQITGHSWDELITREDLHRYCQQIAANSAEMPAFASSAVLAPVVSQEVWAAGVTYYRSRSARIEESKDAGGGDFYDRVYSAPRPEIFFKATGRRVVPHQQTVRIRSDAKWSVPEPELTLLISPQGSILGYTIGNDMSSRDIEGENPLYLPQAKLYDGSCALGPCVYVAEHPLPRTTEIHIEIQRAHQVVFTGSTSLAEIKREFTQLVEFLYRDNSFPQGAFLMTGTGVVPPDTFTLASGDRIAITIEPIGQLVNSVA